MALRLVCLLLLLSCAQSALAQAKDQFGDSLPAGSVARFGTVRLRHAGPVQQLFFSLDGKHLVSAGNDSTVRLWELTTGSEIRRFPGKPATWTQDWYSPRRILLDWKTMR